MTGVVSTRLALRLTAALKIIEGTRSKLVSQQLRTSFLGLESRLLRTLYRSTDADAPKPAISRIRCLALQASERARARSLLDILIEAAPIFDKA